jgi:hypothetical protein
VRSDVLREENELEKREKSEEEEATELRKEVDARMCLCNNFQKK